jgi:hypothetical protein
LPKAADHCFGVIIGRGDLRRGRDDQRDLAPRVGILGPMPQLAQRAGTHFLVEFCQLAQNHGSPIAKNFQQVLQCRSKTPRGFEYDEREASRRGAGNQSQALPSLSGQEPKCQERTIDQP